MDSVKTALTAADKAHTEADKALRGNQGIIKAAVHLEELGVSHKKNLNAVFGKQPIEQTGNLLIGKLLRSQKTTGIHPWFFRYQKQPAKLCVFLRHLLQEFAHF